MKKREIGHEILEGIKAIKKGNDKKLFKSINSINSRLTMWRTSVTLSEKEVEKCQLKIQE